MFHKFSSQEERRNFGGSAFLEMQFCKMHYGVKIKNIVAVANIKHWQNDSLYIDDVNSFFNEYSHIFNCGTYNNLKTGTVDIHGINYYAPSLTESIIDTVLEYKPKDYEILIEWLEIAKRYNGFYILG